MLTTHVRCGRQRKHLAGLGILVAQSQSDQTHDVLPALGDDATRAGHRVTPDVIAVGGFVLVAGDEGLRRISQRSRSGFTVGLPLVVAKDANLVSNFCGLKRPVMRLPWAWA